MSGEGTSVARPQHSLQGDGVAAELSAQLRAL